MSQEEVSSNPTQRIGAVAVEQLPLKELLLASEAAAKRGAEVISIFIFILHLNTIFYIYHPFFSLGMHTMPSMMALVFLQMNMYKVCAIVQGRW